MTAKWNFVFTSIRSVPTSCTHVIDKTKLGNIDWQRRWADCYMCRPQPEHCSKISSALPNTNKLLRVSNSVCDSNTLEEADRRDYILQAWDTCDTRSSSSSSFCHFFLSPPYYSMYKMRQAHVKTIRRCKRYNTYTYAVRNIRCGMCMRKQ